MALWDNAACMDIDRFLDRLGVRHCPPTLGSTLGDPPGHGHTDGSYHYREQDGGPRGSTGQARDLGTACSDCDTIARILEPFARGPNRVLDELIWTRRLPRTGIYYSKGIAYRPSLALAWQHRNHVHAAERVGFHLPAIVGPKPQPMEDEMKGHLIQCRADGQFGDPAKNREGWFCALLDPRPVKWHVPTDRLADAMFAHGHTNNARPEQVDASVFDAYTTV